MSATTTGISARLATITPEDAEELLLANDHNRSVERARVTQYANDLRNGTWDLNGEAIKVAESGRLLDGQHRLMAVLEADTPMTTLLITGLPDEAQETMDQGKPRSFADVLKLRGEKYCTGLAGATRMVFAYERDGVPFVISGRHGTPSVPQLSRTLERNPELRDSVRLAYEYMRRPWVPVTTIAGLHYLFASASQEDADDFVHRLASGADLGVDDPRYVLRERLIREHAQTDERRISAKVKTAFIVLAWNAYRQGEPLERLRWNPGGASPDRFPDIDGLVSR